MEEGRIEKKGPDCGRLCLSFFDLSLLGLGSYCLLFFEARNRVCLPGGRICEMKSGGNTIVLSI